RERRRRSERTWVLEHRSAAKTKPKPEIGGRPGLLRYRRCPANWPLLRQALVRMGRRDLIGSGPDQLVPGVAQSPRYVEKKGRGSVGSDARSSASARGGQKRFATQHTGLPSFSTRRTRKGR